VWIAPRRAVHGFYDGAISWPAVSAVLRSGRPGRGIVYFVAMIVMPVTAAQTQAPRQTTASAP
jgi:hypothetical protein